MVDLISSFQPCSLQLQQVPPFHLLQPEKTLAAFNRTFNNGTVGGVTSWMFETIKLPPVEEGYKFALRGKIPYADASLGVDNLRIITNQRCSPR